MRLDIQTDEFGEHSINIRDANQCDIDTIEWPTGFIRQIIIEGSGIDRLITLPSCMWLGCYDIGLRILFVPDGVEFVHCDRNFLTEIELPESILEVDVSDNLLTRISARNPFVGLPRLRVLKAGGRNNIRTLDFDIPRYLREIEIEIHDAFSDEWKDHIHRYTDECEDKSGGCSVYESNGVVLPNFTEEEILEHIAGSEERMQNLLANYCPIVGGGDVENRAQ